MVLFKNAHRLSDIQPCFVFDHPNKAALDQLTRIDLLFSPEDQSIDVVKLFHESLNSGAEYGIRTHDLNLGKVAFYR